ncbi:UNVERIFIED_CONTAM: hypothetical protein PYX00_001338 [Menopon gallinae]|uniref:alpha-mannosidase n=1 Tax=Menopon gallinae TaxID=328185 RepID=A0AAW2IDJ6_9NEOP
MVQGLVNMGFYQVYNKTYEEKSPKLPKRKNHVKNIFCVKWKIMTYSSILVTGVFIMLGIITYFSLGHGGNCRKGLINVHVIPYMGSTLDPYVPFDTYFENEIYKNLDTILQGLESDHSRRFTITEVYPLWKWWKNQTNEVQRSVRRLIKEGRLEVAWGGWCIPDEASINYNNFINLFTLGLRYLEDIAGRQLSPDVSFLMDNNGHSKEIASLLKAMQVKGLMLGGVSRQEQCYRRSNQKMDFLWSCSSILGIGHEKPNLLTSVLDETALRLDKYFSVENPKIDLNEFQKDIMCQSNGYRTNNIFVPIGKQIKLKYEKDMFRIIDSLVNVTLHDPKNLMNIFYSTPSQYLNSIGYNNERWWRSFADFLPYAQSKFEYWTGYYSSRPSLKYLQKITSQFLQVFKQVAALVRMGGNNTLRELEEAVGLSLHHKFVTDIDTQTTTDYFRRLLHGAVVNSRKVMSEALNKLVVQRGPNVNYESCFMLNVSKCEISENSGSFIITIYNPSGHYINKYVRIPVSQNNYKVRDGEGVYMKTQIVRIPIRMLSLPERKSRAMNELIFRATKIPPLGFKSYYISVVIGPPKEYSRRSTKRISLVFDDTTNKIVGMFREGKRYQISQEMMYYQSRLPWNSVFRPDSTPQTMRKAPQTKLLVRGELVTEYEQTFGYWLHQIVSVYEDEDYIEFKWIAGPIPAKFLTGREVIMSFKTDIKNNRAFFTDSNGRGFERRVATTKPEESISEYITRNYRALNSHIGILDSHYQLHVFNDRVQGGSSLFDGEIEIMVHRKFLNYPFGDTNVNKSDEEIATGQHWVFYGDTDDRNLSQSILKFERRHQKLWYFFAGTKGLEFKDWSINHRTQFSALRDDLPDKLKVLSLEPWKENQLMLRLENSDNRETHNIEIDLGELFKHFRVVRAGQVTLAGNGFKEENSKSGVFKTNAGIKNEKGIPVTNLRISVLPMQIAAYILDIES